MALLITILTALMPVLELAPQLITVVENFIAAFKGGGKAAAQTFLANQMAKDTEALEEQLQTPIKGS